MSISLFLLVMYVLDIMYFRILKHRGLLMNNLLVIYDKEHANSGTLSYIKAIKDAIKDYTIIDINDLGIAEISDKTKILVLKPMSLENEEKIKNLYKDRPELDIEGQWTSKFTTTAAAILKMVKDMFGDKRIKVAIINQSETLGIPLAKRMLDLGYGVLSFNTISETSEIESVLKAYEPDILITATGNDNFIINVDKSVPVIDLSHDVAREKNVIRHIPTVHMLRDRLISSYYEEKRQWWEDDMVAENGGLLSTYNSDSKSEFR